MAEEDGDSPASREDEERERGVLRATQAEEAILTDQQRENLSNVRVSNACMIIGECEKISLTCKNSTSTSAPSPGQGILEPAAV